MRRTTFCIGSLLLLALTAAGQLNKTTKIHHASYPPPLTGTLTNPVWRDASIFTTFHTVSPEPGKKPSERTAVYLLVDNDNLYAALRMDDRQPRAILASATTPDWLNADDWAAICFDTSGDHRSAVVFQVNPAGIQANGVLDASGKLTRTAEVPWKTVARHVPTGWIAEISIPLSSLGIHNLSQIEMGFKVIRHIGRNSEVSEGPAAWAESPATLAQMQRIKLYAEE